MNPKPLSNRKKVQLMVALTILAWATQTLLHQWARGQEAPATDAPRAAHGEHFVPTPNGIASAATLELRADATVHGGEIQLKQICRWSGAEAKFFAPMADLTVARFTGTTPFQAVSLTDLRQTLHDAGANLAVIHFCGATSCTVTRSDVTYKEEDALQQWADAKDGKVKAASPLDSAMKASQKQQGTTPLLIPPADLTPDEVKPAKAAPATAQADAQQPAGQTLRELIIADAAVRLNVPAEQLQMSFNPADDHLLNLAEPQFKFNLEAQRVWNLGDVEWNVLVVTQSGNKRFPIKATARAWQMQVTLVRPIAARQVIQKDDVVAKRVLVDHQQEDLLLSMAQSVGQEASRELKPGTIMTAHMVNPVDLAKPGQFVTVTMLAGNVRIKTVGRAMEAGTFGQTIKVKNEATDAIYEVVLTAPQEGTVSPTRVSAVDKE